MSAQPAPAEPPPEPAAPRTQAFLRFFERAMEIGAELIEECSPAADAARPEPERIPAAQRAENYDRVLRAMRRTALLVEHLEQPAQPSRAQQCAAARKHILRTVEDAIQQSARRPADADALEAELRERLEDVRLDDEFLVRPLDDIANELRRDLGIAGQPGARFWKRRTPEDIAVLNARAERRPAPEHHAPGDEDPEDEDLPPSVIAILRGARFREK